MQYILMHLILKPLTNGNDWTFLTGNYSIFVLYYINYIYYATLVMNAFNKIVLVKKN